MEVRKFIRNAIVNGKIVLIQEIETNHRSISLEIELPLGAKKGF